MQNLIDAPLIACDDEAGRVRFWARATEGTATYAGLIAVLADCVPIRARLVLAGVSTINRLDNVLGSCVACPRHGWLYDVQVVAALDGLVHGMMHLFAEDGLLVATASKSGVLREPG